MNGHRHEHEIFWNFGHGLRRGLVKNFNFGLEHEIFYSVGLGT